MSQNDDRQIRKLAQHCTYSRISTTPVSALVVAGPACSAPRRLPTQHHPARAPVRRPGSLQHPAQQIGCLVQDCTLWDLQLVKHSPTKPWLFARTCAAPVTHFGASTTRCISTTSRRPPTPPATQRPNDGSQPFQPFLGLRQLQASHITLADRHGRQHGQRSASRTQSQHSREHDRAASRAGAQQGRARSSSPEG